jgi:hypothetical protein
MADLTCAANLRFKGEVKTEIITCDTSAGQTIYRGQPLIFNSTDTANAVAYVDSINVAATDVFVGIAAENKTVAASAVEANTTIEAYVGPSIVGFKSTVFSVNGSLGSPVYMSTSSTLSATCSDNVFIGTLFAIQDGYCYVKLSAPQICLLADT